MEKYCKRFYRRTISTHVILYYKMLDVELEVLAIDMLHKAYEVLHDNSYDYMRFSKLSKEDALMIVKSYVEDFREPIVVNDS